MGIVSTLKCFPDQVLQDYVGKISILQANYPLQISNQQSLYTISYSNNAFIYINVKEMKCWTVYSVILKRVKWGNDVWCMVQKET